MTGRKAYTRPAITEIGRLHEVIETQRFSGTADGAPFDPGTGQLPTINPESF